MTTTGNAPKVQRGYTKHGYPIVWLRNNTHEQCMDKLRQTEIKEKTPIPLEKPETVKMGKIGNVKFEITCEDTRNITLKVGSMVTYHSDLEGVANALRRVVEKVKIQEMGGCDKLEQLVKIAQETKELIRKALG